MDSNDFLDEKLEGMGIFSSLIKKPQQMSEAFVYLMGFEWDNGIVRNHSLIDEREYFFWQIEITLYM
jgi:hypothetical protein